MFEHAESWMGYPVKFFTAKEINQVPDYANVIYRIATGYGSRSDPGFAELLKAFVSHPGCSETPGLIIGSYVSDTSDSEPIVEMLVAHREKFPKLRGIFMGDMTSEDMEISWIEQG